MLALCLGIRCQPLKAVIGDLFLNAKTGAPRPTLAHRRHHEKEFDRYYYRHSAIAQLPNANSCGAPKACRGGELRFLAFI